MKLKDKYGDYMSWTQDPYDISGRVTFLIEDIKNTSDDIDTLVDVYKSFLKKTMSNINMYRNTYELLIKDKRNNTVIMSLLFFLFSLSTLVILFSFGFSMYIFLGYIILSVIVFMYGYSKKTEIDVYIDTSLFFIGYYEEILSNLETCKEEFLQKGVGV